jgi:hypothetical protein
MLERLRDAQNAAGSEDINAAVEELYKPPATNP